MKCFTLLALMLFSQFSFASQSSIQLEGKWQAKRYLDIGIQDGKVKPIGAMQMKPEHFAYLFFNPKQQITIKIAKPVVAKTVEEKRANEALKIFEFIGELQSNDKILDSGCTKIPYYKTHVACEYKPGTVIPLQFNVTLIDSPSFEDNRKRIEERFKKNGLNDIFATLTTSKADGSSGGTFMAFVGKQHLILVTTYYAKPVSVKEAHSMTCPAGNVCTSTGLLFERVQ